MLHTCLRHSRKKDADYIAETAKLTNEPKLFAPDATYAVAVAAAPEPAMALSHLDVIIVVVTNWARVLNDPLKTSWRG